MSSKKNSDSTNALKAAGLNVTAQRLAVCRAIATHEHATAEEAYDFVREEIGTVSRQAVYDALNTLSEHSILRRFQPSGSPARYETRVDNHHHLLCRSCRKLVDVDCAKGKAPCLHPIDDHGYQIDEAEVIYWGLCPDCQDLP